MLSISTIGLILDFVGVLLLGFDLIRVQHSLRRQSRKDVQRLQEISAEYGGLSAWLDELACSGDWRESQYEEGRIVFYDGFDLDMAKRDFQDLTAAAKASQSFASSVALFVTAQVQSAEEAARSSLILSYFGVGLITIGFGLQLWG